MKPSHSPTFYDLLGGEPALRAIIDQFVDRMFVDPMIGFFFRHADRARIKEKEFELAAQMLGGPVRYRGKPLGDTHKPHRIMGGQFNRRSQILREVLQAHGVPAEVERAWMSHVEALRSQITRDSSDECIG